MNLIKKALFKYKVDTQIYKNYTFYIFTNSLSVLIPILISPILINNYNLVEYGYMMLIQSIMLFFSLLFDNGLRLFYIRNISNNRENKIDVCLQFNTFMNIKFLISIVFSVLYLGFVLFFVQDAYKLLYSVSLLIFIGNLYNPVFFLIGIEKFTIVSLFNAFARLLYLASFLFILNDHTHNYLNNLILGTSYCVISIIMFFYINLKYQLTLAINLRNKKILSDSVKALPLVINNAYQNLDVYLHNFLVGFLAKNNDLGLFTAIEKFYSMFKQGIIALIEILYPRVCSAINIKKSKQNLNSIIVPLNIFFLITYLFVFTYKSEISFYLTRDNGEMQKNLLLIFMTIPFFIINLNFKSHLELMALKLDSYLSRITFLTLLSKSILCVFFFYFFGLYGIAITLISTEVISGISKSIRVNKELSLHE